MIAGAIVLFATSELFAGFALRVFSVPWLAGWYVRSHLKKPE